MSVSIKSVVNSASESKEISYDDTTSQLGATNIQDAIDKVSDKTKTIEQELGVNKENLINIINSTIDCL